MASADRNGDSGATAERHAPRVSLALEQLRRGEISLDQYVEARLDAATERLRGVVSGERLAMIREVVRKSLDSDPVTQEYLRRLTARVDR